MTVLGVLALAWAGTVVPSRALSARSLKERPVMKVVRLLQDMKAQLEGELADDKAVHEDLACWCKTNDELKTKAIAVGEATEAQLKAFLGEAEAKMVELKTKRDATLQEVDDDFNALEKARSIRMKENKAFHADSANLEEAIMACGQAIEVLREYHPDAANLAQVRAAAQRLQQAQVVSLSKRTGGPSSEQMAALKAFLSQAQGTVSFLAIPGYQSYAPQSGQIFGVLEQMKEDFEKDLKDSTATEQKAEADFQALKAAKEEEIQAGRTLVAKLDGEIGDLKAKHAEAFKELEDTQAQLELDRTFLANLKKKCSESKDEFDQRVKDRLEEIAAVDDTIGILNSDTSFDNFEKTVNSFLQMSSAEQETQQQQERLHRTSTSLREAAARLGSPQLALLASRAQLDAFTRVKADIDKMVAELTQQNQDEISHRDWCIDEFAVNKRDTAAADDKKESLQAQIADLEKNIEYLTKEIGIATEAIASSQDQMRRASESREAENADFQTTVNDQRLTQMILNKALARMKEVYAFLQREDPKPGAPHVQLSGNHTDPGNGPARFLKYSKNAGGSRVVRMLEEVIADSTKLENDARQAEEDAQSAYDEFMQDSNRGITAYQRKIVNMNGARASAKESLSLAESDLKATMGKLEELNDAKGDLHRSCDFILKNFDARQEARTAEINALNEAKAILSGMK